MSCHGIRVCKKEVSIATLDTSKQLRYVQDIGVYPAGHVERSVPSGVEAERQTRGHQNCTKCFCLVN